MKFIHLTDTHFVPPGESLYGLNPRSRLKPAIQAINREHLDAEFVIISGDLTHRGEEAAYRNLRAVLDGLVLPYHLMLGNHDCRSGLRRVFPEAAVDEHGFVQYTLETDAGVFVMLDTHQPGTEAGHLCPQRLAWLSQTLDAHAAQPVYLFMHHPPMPIGIPGMDAIALQEVDAFTAVVAKHPHIRHLFFGHVHRTLSGSWRGIPFSTLPAINHQVALDLGPNDEVPGSHEAPAFGVVLLDEQSTLVHSSFYTDTSPRFSLSSAQAEAAQTLEELAPHRTDG